MGSETIMKFKIGDKVRIIKYPDGEVVGEIAEVTYVYLPPTTFICDVILLSNKDWVCPMKDDEVEPLVRKGEQLSFSFMEQAG